jgi:hypothetical protein
MLSQKPQPRTRRLLTGLAFALAVAAGVAIATDMLPAGSLRDPLRARPTGGRRIPLAVLGDADSQGVRGHSLQWTEILAHVRPADVDLGDVGVWGGRRLIVRILESLGAERRLPRKRDHQNNFAFGGARCSDLVRGAHRQAQRLAAHMDREPQRWQRGVVVIRIGICDLGGAPILGAMAQDPSAPELVDTIRSCADRVAEAVAIVRARHPVTRFVLVGVLDNADHPPNFENWQSAVEIANIERALDRFDDALRQLANADERITFFDDRAWFRAKWGSRDHDGRPAYRSVAVGAIVRVAHLSGDAPTNSVLADGHAGLVWNTLWCRSLVIHLAERHGLPVAPITDAEVERFLGAQPVFGRG